MFTEYNADGFDPDGDKLRFGAINLPPSLYLNPDTGVIDGIFTQTGTYTTLLGLEDEFGASAQTQAITFIVNP